MGNKIITVRIEAINASFAEELSCLAKNIYREYYLHLWLPGGAEWYMNQYAYAAGKIAAELNDSNNLHYIVYDNESAAGYLKLRTNASLTGHADNTCLEIERIYLHKKSAGKGLGRQLMLFCEQVARQHNKACLFLKAMDSSSGAIAFYEKMGYSYCGSHTLSFPLMKEKYRGMVIMKKEIPT